MRDRVIPPGGLQRLKNIPIMAEIKLENSSSDQTSDVAESITRRELFKKGGKIAAAAAVSSVFSPFFIHSVRAATKTLSFWQFYAPNAASGPQGKWFEDCVAAWNAKNDVKVALQYVPNNDYMNGSKLQTAFASGHGPDIFIISPGDFLRYYNGGVLTDLTPYMDEEAKKDFYPNVMRTREVDGKIYGLPMEVEPMAMYYSVKAFEDAGLTDKDVPTTWDSFLETAKKLTKGKQFGCLFETTPGYYQTFTWYPFLWQGGGEIATPDGKKSAYNSPATVQALKFWQDSIKQNVASRNYLGGGVWDVVANLASGYCAMQNVGIWAVSALRDNAKDFKYGVFPLPVPPGGKPSSDLGGWAFVANAKGQNPEAAAKFIVWALGSMQEDSIQRVVDWCIKAKSDVSPRKSAMDKGTAAGGYDSAPMKMFKDVIFPTGRGEPRLAPEVYKAVSDSIQACQLGGTDLKQAAEQASGQIDSFLAGYSGAPML